ncbi:peptide-methionine (S)-S-oxide reductase MsrA [Pedobacter sp. HDW13]|uniref:peptide-methionine (S)-S-oxide reductase MsrA n=1 Tax=unclassified Pedobacter TaxID=2628915 RepID=UPI000F5AD2EF|nr:MULTISPECIES: peptide-methionine (S)-S-oxide reductase MsrA [unclassified Pedobacter]QIL38680.1 peptide-methionine (S)-S-oxide reductase MsrA [Pedobacter sp. HDW13]RQO80157.1 peptide-methionine (S)-S-oxide reductase [Pedobacter sp. KBW01]
MQTATFGGGCFWCTEAVFQALSGVTKVTSGYMGGDLKHPTYMEICNGDTGHAEVVQLIFDENIISFNELLFIFFKTHNPTTRNRQGNDVGSQYRSVIFYENDDQKTKIDQIISALTQQNVFEKPIITEVIPTTEFYEAEDYHQNYFNDNQGKPYCSFVIQPKLNKFAIDFRNKIKPELLE